MCHYTHLASISCIFIMWYSDTSPRAPHGWLANLALKWKKKRLSSDWPNLGSNPCTGTKPWHYYWGHVVLADRSLAWLSSERLHPAADGNRCRDPQPHIRWSLGSLIEELGEGLKDQKGTGIPQEDQERQDTWTHGGFQRLHHQTVITCWI